MAKRYFSTDLFHEDWFTELKPDEKLFFVYAILNCDHAGFLRVNLRVFNALNGTQLVPEVVFSSINQEKQRLREITPRVWFIEDFIQFQYGHHLNPNNRVHQSVLDLIEKNGVSLASIKGLNRPLIGVKEKDKDKEFDKENVRESVRERGEVPTLENVEHAFVRSLTSQGLPLDAYGGVKELAESFFNHYGSQGWVKGNGLPIHNVQLLISKWVTTEKNRIASTKNSVPTTKQPRPWD